MRTFTIGILLQYASCSLAAFGQAAPAPNTPVAALKVSEPQKAAATPEDLAVAEVVLSDVAKDKKMYGLMGSRDATQIVVSNKDYENFKPSNPNVIMSDLKDLYAALEKARAEPDYMFELDYTVSSKVYRKLIPNARALVFIRRPQYLRGGSASFFFSYGPLPHGRAQCTYTLARKQGQWKIVKKKISIPM